MEVNGTSTDATPLPPAVAQTSLDAPGMGVAASPLAPWTSAGRTLGEPVPLPMHHHPTLDDVEQWESYGDTGHDEIEPGGPGSEVVPWTVVDAPPGESTWSAVTVEEATLELEDHHIAEAESAAPRSEPSEAAFPWDDSASGDALSPWEALGKAVKESVAWSELEAAAPPLSETWELKPADRVEPATVAWTTEAVTLREGADAGEHDVYAQLAQRLERFAEELRLHGHPAISRALAGDRLEAALASMIAGYVAAARHD